MKFDININYAIDLDKCNERVKPLIDSSNVVKLPIKEKKYLKYQINFLNDEKLFLFIENDADFGISKLVNKNKRIKIERLNAFEYNIEIDRFDFNIFLLCELKNVFKTFEWKYSGILKVTCPEHLEAIKKYTDLFQKRFFDVLVCPFWGYYVEKSANESFNIYTDDERTRANIQDGLMYGELTKEFRINFIKDYFDKVTDRVLKENYLNSHPFNSISFSIVDEQDVLRVESKGIILSEIESWLNQNLVCGNFAFKEPKNNMFLQSLLKRSEIKFDNVVSIVKDSSIEIFGWFADINEAIATLSK